MDLDNGLFSFTNIFLKATNISCTNGIFQMLRSIFDNYLLTKVENVLFIHDITMNPKENIINNEKPSFAGVDIRVIEKCFLAVQV